MIRLFFSLSLLCALMEVSSLRAQQAFEVVLPNLVPASNRSVVRTADGGICILASYSLSDGMEDKSKLGGDTSFFALIKLSPNGAIEWKSYASTDKRYAHTIALRSTPDGGFIAAGGAQEGTPETLDIVLARFGAHGNLLWMKSYDGGMADLPSDCLLLDDGSILVVGKSWDGTSRTDGRFYSLAAIHLTSDGEVLNSWTYDNTATPNIYTDIITICGYDSTSVTLIGSVWRSPMLSAGLLCKLGLDGKGTQGRIFSAPEQTPNTKYETAITDMIPTSNGGYELLGYAVADSLLSFSNVIHYSIGFALSYDSEGNVLRRRRYTDSFFSTTLFKFFSGGNFLVGESWDLRGDPATFVRSERDSTGGMIDAIACTPFPLEEDDGYFALIGRVGFVPAEDNGIFTVRGISGSLTGSEVEQTFQMIVSRLNPDFTSCRGKSEHVPLPGAEDYYSVALPSEPLISSFPPAFFTMQAPPAKLDSIMKSIVPERNEPKVQRVPLPSLPLSGTIELVPREMKVTTYSHPGAQSRELPIEPKVFCGRQELPDGSGKQVVREEKDSTLFLQISPNSIRSGERVDVDFRLPVGSQIVEMGLIRIATGETVRQIERSSMHWSATTGEGNTTFWTDELRPGAYLLRIRLYNRQVTARLEVR